MRRIGDWLFFVVCAVPWLAIGLAEMHDEQRALADGERQPGNGPWGELCWPTKASPSAPEAT